MPKCSPNSSFYFAVPRRVIRSPGDLRIWKRVFLNFLNFAPQTQNFWKSRAVVENYKGEASTHRGAPNPHVTQPFLACCAALVLQVAPRPRLGPNRSRSTGAAWRSKPDPWSIIKAIIMETWFSEVVRSFKRTSLGSMLRRAARLENFGARA